MSDNLLDDMAGKSAGEAPREASYRICVDARFVNSIEAELTERMAIEVQSLGVELPMIFIGDDGELEKPTDGRPDPWCKYFDGRTPAPWECAELVKDVAALVDANPRVLVARLRIVIARELGPRATRQQYEERCKQEGIEP
jgi:hypothetical protein